MIIRLADCPSQPWKNGLGRTREIAIHPPTANGENFAWRVSLAEVDSDAPFSRFPGVDRHLVLLQGDGFSMTLDGDRTHALTTPLVPFAFAGEADVQVHLQGGATRDFNLMVRRTAGHGELKVWSEPGTHQLPASTVLVHVAAGTISIDGQRLHVGDSWSTPGIDPASHAFILERGASVLVAGVSPAV